MKEKKAKKPIIRKKKIIIVISVILIITISLVVINRDKILKEEKIEVKESVTANSGDSLDYAIFFKNKIDLNKINVAFTNQDETVSDKNLIIEDNIISSIGRYNVKIEIDGKIYNSVLEVNDKTAPILEVKDLSVKEGENVEISSFVVSCKDNSLKDCLYEITDLDGNKTNIDLSVGTRKYVIIAKDENKNEIKKEVNLTVSEKNNNSNNEENTSNIVSTRNVTEEQLEDAKYGTTYKTTRTYKVTTYKDGSEDKKLIKTDQVLDSSSFNATSKEIEAEARSVTSSNYNAYQEMTNYVNEYRNEVGVRQIQLDNELSVLATIRAIEMSYSEKQSHNRPNGLGFYSVGEEMGYGMMIMGENIDFGYGGYNDTARKAATNWRNSETHYKNMISNGYGTIGVGKYTLDGKTYWVQLFCG